MGYREMPWLEATWFLIIVQMVLAMLTQFQRKDFITITVCALGIYLLTFKDDVRRAQFRMLVLLIFVSMAQDILWLMVNRDTEDDDDDGGVERSVKSFSRKMSYVSLVWRVSINQPLSNQSVFFAIGTASNRAMEGLFRLRVDHQRKEGEPGLYGTGVARGTD